LNPHEVPKQVVGIAALMWYGVENVYQK